MFFIQRKQNKLKSYLLENRNKKREAKNKKIKNQQQKKILIFVYSILSSCFNLVGFLNVFVVVVSIYTAELNEGNRELALF